MAVPVGAGCQVKPTSGAWSLIRSRGTETRPLKMVPSPLLEVHHGRLPCVRCLPAAPRQRARCYRSVMLLIFMTTGVFSDA